MCKVGLENAVFVAVSTEKTSPPTISQEQKIENEKQQNCRRRCGSQPEAALQVPNTFFRRVGRAEFQIRPQREDRSRRNTSDNYDKDDHVNVIAVGHSRLRSLDRGLVSPQQRRHMARVWT